MGFRGELMKIEVKGTDEYALKLSKLKAKSTAVAKKAVYFGAGLVIDKIRENLNALPTVKEGYNLKAYRKGEKSKLSDLQKRGLVNGLGLTPMKYEDGYIHTKVGFDGYNVIKTRKYPKGQPNPLIARVLENGSSFMDGTEFIKKAVNQTRRAAEAKMDAVVEEEIQKIMK